MSFRTLDPGPWGRGGGLVSRLVPQYLYENENKPPSRQTPHVNTRPEEQKSSGRKKKPPFLQVRQPETPSTCKAETGLPLSAVGHLLQVLLCSAQPSDHTPWSCSHQLLIL